MRVSVITLDGFQIQAGQDVRLSNAEAALLVLLSWTSGSRVTRDWLIGTMWDDVPTASRRHSLSQLLYQIHRKLPSVVLSATTSAMQVDSHTLTCDASEFVKYADSGAFNEAINVHQRPFLEEGLLAPSRAFEEWAESVRQSLNLKAARVLRHVLAKSQSSGDWHSVEILADRLIRIDRFDEGSHAARLLAIAAGGRSDVAANDYQRLLDHFRAELGRLPSNPDLLRLARIPHLPSVAPIRFVGRAREFKALCNEWIESTGSRLRMVALCGEAGIGKSRLVDHFLRYAAIRGGRVFIGRCIPEERDLPFASFANLLGDGIRTADLRHLDAATRRSLRSVVHDSLLGESDEPATQRAADPRFADLETADACAKLLSAMSLAGPLVLFLDDAHWADEATTTVLKYLRVRLTDVPVLIMCACRYDDFEDRSIGRFVSAGPLAGPHQVLNLGPLSHGDSFQLIEAFEAATGVVVPIELRDTLYRQFGGHPFFMLESLKDYRIGRIRLEAPRAEGDSALQVRLPMATAAYLSNRFAKLGHVAWKIVEVLAIAGTPVTTALVRGIIAVEFSDFANAVHELVDRGMLVEDDDGMRLTHRLLTDAARLRIDASRCRYLHGRIAEYLALASTTTPARLIFHLEGSGDSAKAHEVQVRAADAALEEYNYGTAEYLARKAVASAPTGQLRVASERRLIRLLVSSGKMADALPFAHSLRPCLIEADDLEGVVMCDAVILCANLLRASMPSDAVLRDALSLIVRARRSDNLVLVAKILSMLAESAHDAGREEFLIRLSRGLGRRARDAGVSPAAATLYALAARLGCLYTSAAKGAEHGARAVAIAELFNDKPLLVSCLTAAATARMREGAFQAALNTFEKAFTITEDPDLHYLRRRVANNYAVCLMELGREEAAASIMQTWLAGAELHDQLFLDGNLALVYLAMNRLSEAVSIGERLIATNQVLRMPWLEAFALAILGTVHLATGEIDAATELAERTRGIVGCRRYMVSDQSHVDIFLARAAAASGDVTGAIAHLAMASEACRHVNFGGFLRLQLAEVEMILSSDRPLASKRARAIRQLASRAGASSVLARVARLLD